jgi:hypothetical protein
VINPIAVMTFRFIIFTFQLFAAPQLTS